MKLFALVCAAPSAVLKGLLPSRRPSRADVCALYAAMLDEEFERTVARQSVFNYAPFANGMLINVSLVDEPLQPAARIVSR